MRRHKVLCSKAMKFILSFILMLMANLAANACTTCNRGLQADIRSSGVFPNLPLMLSAFFVTSLLVILLSFLSIKRHQAAVISGRQNDAVPMGAAATVLGIGLGGFADGIILHQILQWHEMLSNKIPVTDLNGKSVNMFWDGIFHLFCLLVVITGVVLLWRLCTGTINRSGKLLAGGLLAGWAAFNLIEGIIDHQLLKLHNVKETTSEHAPWNYAFLGLSLVMLLVGLAKMRPVKIQELKH
jgi:uncharacterized membrane protein